MADTSRYTELTFQAIVDASPSALLLVNRDGKIAYCNAFAERLFGYNRAELVGQPVAMLIPEQVRHRHPGFVASFFSTPQSRAMGAGRDLYTLGKDGREFPVEIGLSPLTTAEGTMVLAAVIDISERRKAEDRFRMVVESSPNAMILVNHEGVITLVNKATEVLFRYERSELVGKKIEILIPASFDVHHHAFREAFFKHPEARRMGTGRDLFGLRKDEMEIPIEIGLNPMETPEGLMVLASVIDISERKQKEAAVKRQIELEARNKELEQFAYVASHDLREPLRTVSNYMQVMREDCIEVTQGPASNYLDSMQRAIARMESLIDALLDYSRLGTGATVTTVDMNRLVREILSDLSYLIKDKDVTIHTGPLPTIRGFEPELRQLLASLTSNAIKFRKHGLPAVITIEAKEMRNQWQFTVNDNGIGIQAKHAHKIFQIFQRLHTRDSFEGNGIGLANCKKIVELHGGTIWVESSPGQGSAFHFTIPTNRP